MEEEIKETKVSLKLLVDTEGKKVLFAEASKDFVDFLFHIMELPIGTVVKLVKLKDMAGCLGDLYESIESFNGDYLQADVNRDSVLKPKVAVSVPLLSLNDAPTLGRLYRCYRCTSYVSNDPSAKCPYCGSKISTALTFVHPTKSSATSSNGSGGYVKGLLTYMVMDNLEVKPMSTISAITLLNKFHVKDISSLMEKEVQVGLNEGVAILKASLETRSVLSTVFLGKKLYGFECI